MHALIVGSGIAGAVAGIALRKAGHQCTIYEAFPHGADDVGAFLTIMHNGMDALHAVDAYAAVAAVSHPAHSVATYDHTGERLTRRDYLQDHRRGPRTLMRSTLHRALHDLARARGCTVRHNKKLGHITTSATGVRLEFADGTHADGDFAIGADGVHSTTRGLLNPADTVPRYTGMRIVYGTTAPRAHAEGSYHMYGGLAAFGYTSTPDQTLWFARISQPRLPVDRAGRLGTHAQRDLIEAHFRGRPIPARELIHDTAPGDIVVSNGFDVPSTPIWSNGRVVLVGDAAHAASPAAGQGASMALEDAVTLAQCVRDIPALSAAFARYETLRRDRVERLVATSAGQDDHRVDTGHRDARPTATHAPATEDTLEWLYGHHIDWSATVTTPAP